MEEKKYCYKYPHPAVTTDCVIFGFDGTRLQVLLVQRGIDPYKGRWAFPGGFLKMDESCEHGALRERVITVAYYALVKIQQVRGGDDAARVDWFALDEVPPLAFDHDMILREALKRLRERIHFEPVGFELLPEKFTMKQLQNLYEAILDVRFDRRNFTKKMLHFNILTQLDETTRPTPKREAVLYSFNEESYNELKQKGFRLEF